MDEDRFKISMTLRHPSLDPNEISSVFAIKPIFSWIAGSRAGEIVNKYSVWHGVLAQGAGGDEYEEALKDAVLLIESGKEWLSEHFNAEGELDVIFAFWTDLNDGKICQTTFYPELLARLSALDAGIEVEIWKDEGASE